MPAGALEDVERLAGMDRRQRLRLAETDRLNRAIVDLNRAGKYAEAVPLARKALATSQAVLGERHPDTALSLNNLAGLLQAQGDYAAAKPLYEQALAIDKEALGEKHPGYATYLNNLASLLKAQGTTPPPSPSTSRLWRSARRCSASATPTPPKPEQPGGVAPGARGLRRRQAPL